jgi:methionine-rich copper-binding protein CopC
LRTDEPFSTLAATHVLARVSPRSEVRMVVRRWILAACALAAAACGGEMPEPDAGLPEEDAGPSPADAGPRVDAGMTDAGSEPDVAPFVTSTRPDNGAMEIAGDRELEVRFSEAMDPNAGTITARVGGVDVPLAAPSWNEEEDVLFVAPSSRWPSASRIDVSIAGFADAEGTSMEGPFEMVFHTNDEGPPSVVSATPAEGSMVDAAVSEIVLVFSEPMNPYVGTLDGAALGERVWMSPEELRVAISGLEAGASVRIALDGFEDVAGNALDGTMTLGDGALDFTTAPDTDPPALSDSNPTNGQLDVAVLTQREIVLLFDEPMDTSLRTASLDDGATAATLTGNWSADGTELTFSVAGRLRANALHGLDVSAMRDRAGNALDGSVGLSAGVLEFTTTVLDEALPFVQFTSPAEGERGVATRIANVEILFSEAMDTSRTAVDLVSSRGTRTLAGVWNAAGTRLTLPVGAPLYGHTAYSIDVSAFSDASGNALEVAHPYLGDALLQFTTGGATGESCADPLTTLDATRDGAALVWPLLGNRFLTSDQPPICAGSTLRDGFVAYDKATGPLGTSGGRALRVTVTADRAHLFNLAAFEILSGACERASGTREVCGGGRREWVQYLDAPAGSYFVSLAMSASDGTVTNWSGLTLRIEEVTSIPEGESCGDPFDASSAIYTQLAADDHQWILPHGAGTSVEQNLSTASPDTFSCVTSSQGPDTVVRVEKTRASSILDVMIEPFPADSSVSGTHVEARTSCDRSPEASEVLACTRSVGTTPRTIQVDAPPGPVYLWVAASDPEAPTLQTTLRVREIDPGPGETCLTAIPIATDATNAITPAATTDFFHPSCLPTGAVTWYRYRTTREVTTVRTAGAGAVAMIAASNSSELECVADAVLANVGRRLPVGTDVCIAVPSGSTVGSLIVREHDWRSIAGTVTSLGIARPVDAAGAPITITGESWLTADATSLYMGIAVTSNASAGIVIAPRAGGASELVRTPMHNVIGHGGAMFGQSLFSIDERTTAPPRLFRLIDSLGAPEPAGTAWDTGSVYPAVAMRGLTRVVGQDTLAIAGGNTTSATFFTIPATGASTVTNRGANTNVSALNAIAANDTYVFFTGSVRIAGTARSSVYRLPWTGLATATPRLLVPWDSVSVGTGNAGIVYDAARDILYFRSTQSGNEGVFAVFDAATDAPYFAGRVAPGGRSADAGLAFDPAVPSLFFFETQSDTNGNFVEVR